MNTHVKHPERWQNIAKTAITIGIAGAILTQAYAGFRRLVCGKDIPVICSIPKDPQLYPFLNYGMYSRVHTPGSEIAQHRLVAVFEDGTEKELTADDLVTTDYLFNSVVIRPLSGQDSSRIRPFLDQYEQAGNPPFPVLKLESDPLILTEEGVKQEERKVVYSISTETLKPTETSEEQN